MPKKKTRRVLGAATDNPVALASRAVREAHIAEASSDQDGIRQAAEKTWLAMSSLADVAAARLGRPPPGGAIARRATFRALEQKAKLRSGRITHEFELARTVLHGQCFHGDECPVNTVEMIHEFHEVVKEGMGFIKKLPRKK